MPTIHDHVQVGLERLGLDTPSGGTPGGGGENNIGANVGSGEGRVYRDKTGVTLNFRTLKAETGISILTDGDVIKIENTALGDDPDTNETYDNYGTNLADVAIDGAEGQGSLTFSPYGSRFLRVNLSNATRDVGGLKISSESSPTADDDSKGYLVFRRSDLSEDDNIFDTFGVVYSWEVRHTQMKIDRPVGNGERVINLQDKFTNSDAWGVYGERTIATGPPEKGYLKCRVLNVPQDNKLEFSMRAHSWKVIAETGDVTWTARGAEIPLNSSLDIIFNTVKNNIVGAVNEVRDATQTNAAAISALQTVAHNRQHAMDSGSDHTMTASKMIHSDGDSVIQEFSIGAAGTYLKSNGAGSTPTWDTPGGASLGNVWEYVSGTGDSDPGSGKFKLNNSSPPSATFMYISDETENGGDWRGILLGLKENDRLYVQEQEDSSRYHIYRVTADPTGATNYVKVPIVAEDSGSNIRTGEKCGIVFLFTGGGGGGTGFTHHGEFSTIAGLLGISSPSDGDSAFLNDPAISIEKKFFRYKGSGNVNGWGCQGETTWALLQESCTQNDAMVYYESTATGTDDNKIRRGASDDERVYAGQALETKSAGNWVLVAKYGIWKGYSNGGIKQGEPTSCSSNTAGNRARLEQASSGDLITGICINRILSSDNTFDVMVTPRAQG